MLEMLDYWLIQQPIMLQMSDYWLKQQPITVMHARTVRLLANPFN